MLLIFCVCCWLTSLCASENVMVETCATTPLKGTVFCDKTKSYDERIDFIVGKLTVDEGLGHVMLNDAYACQFGTYHVVSYPQVINLGRTFNMTGVHQMTTQISDTGRALYNAKIFFGVSYFSPVINLIRDPRWGRLQENAGEDPYLLGEYSKAYITGMQRGPDPKYFKSVATAKHYTAYDLENWEGMDRHHFNAIVSDRDMEEIFNRPFQIAIEEAKVKQIMCSYNAINGIPACAHKELLTDVARGKFGFDGYFMSDWGAVEDIYKTHKYTKTIEDACAVSLRAGMDLNDGTMFNLHLKDAITQGKLNASELDVHVKRVMMRRFEIGEFDSPWSEQMYHKIPISVVNSKEHKDLAYKLSLESMVLLKNEKSTLPLDSKTVGTVGLIGPHIDSTDVILGSYVGPHDKVDSVLDVVKKRVSNVVHAKGCETTACETTLLFEEAKRVAKSSDLVILVMGLMRDQEREGHDRTSLKFPGHQGELIKLVEENTKGNVILVMIKGGPIDVSDEKKSEKISAILDAGYPGQFGGEAIADVLFGEYSPAGRLTYTVYPEEYAEKIPMTDMRMRPEGSFPGRTYRFFTGSAVYAFGDGLSYTEFAFNWLSNHEEPVYVCPDDEASLKLATKTLKVNVTNVGKVDSDVVVLAFMSNLIMDDAPIKELVGFKRIHLPAGHSQIVEFDVSGKMFEYVDVHGKRRILEGEYEYTIENLKKRIFLEY